MTENCRSLSDRDRRPVDHVRLAVELDHAASFLHRQGVGDGSTAVDVAKAELARLRAALETQDPSMDLANVNAAYVVERDDNARLRAALEHIVEACEHPSPTIHGYGYIAHSAREALNGGEHDRG